MIREQAIDLAKEYAAKSATHYSYLDNVNSDDWTPHEWVIQAIIKSYEMAITNPYELDK